MTVHSVIIYLGIILAGCVVVGIADSFSASEIAARMKIANAQLIFTQDVILRDGKQLPLYERVTKRLKIKATVLPATPEKGIVVSFSSFLCCAVSG